MGSIKKFTVRFDMNRPEEARAARYLREKSESLGISQNACMIQIISRTMKKGNTDPDGGDTKDISLLYDFTDIVKQIVGGVLRGIEGRSIPINITEGHQEDKTRTEMQSGAEMLNEDEMAFLDAFDG